MALAARAALALALLFGAGAACAQPIVASPSAAQRCLTRGELLLGTPTYPPPALERKANGQVTVELEFSAPDAAPRVLTLRASSQGDRDLEALFADAVRDFVKAYRVPCLGADETARLKQEFAFVAHDMRGVTMMASTDAQAQRNQALVTCAKHLRPGETPPFPMAEMRAGHQGTVVVRSEFTAAGEPPRVSVLDDGGSAAFGRVAAEHASGFRLPCHDGGAPVSMTSLYVFRMEGGARVVLTDMSFMTLLRSIKGIRSANVYFDFKTMRCPFEIHFRPMQPHAPNGVGEVGEVVAERRFFLDWLSRQQLELSPRDLNAVLGQSARVAVPCTVLNLGQNRGGGASQ